MTGSSVGLAVAMAAGSLHAAEVAEYVLDAVIQPPQTADSVALSPGGDRLAVARNVEGRLVIDVVDLQTDATTSIDVTEPGSETPVGDAPRFFNRASLAYKGWWGIRRSGNADPTERFINYVEWATDDRLIYRNSIGTLHAVDADGRNRVSLLDFEPMRRAMANAEFARATGTVYRLLPHDPDHISVIGSLYAPGTRMPMFLDAVFGVNIHDGKAFLIAERNPMVDTLMLDRLLPHDPDHFSVITFLNGAFGVSIHDGMAFLIAERNPMVDTLMLDAFGLVRGSVLADPKAGESGIRFHDASREATAAFDEEFGADVVQALGLLGPGDGHPPTGAAVLGFGYSSDILFLASSRDRPTNAVYAANRKNDAILGPLFAPEGFDVAAGFGRIDDRVLVFAEERKEVAGFRYQDIVPRTMWRLPEFAKVQASLDKTLAGRVNEIVDWDEPGQRFLVLSYAGNEPGEVFLLDLQQRSLKRKLRFLPDLDRSRLGETVPIRIETRDARQVLCYVTVPAGVEEGAAPLVVLFADSRWNRVVMDFDEVAQHFAANGFAVLQVNHRGVAGFGRAHLDAARGRYADAALEDVEEAIRWLGERNVFDVKRVFAAGDGLGGWLALHAAVRKPDAIRAVVCLNAVIDPGAVRAPEVGTPPANIRFFDWAAADPDKSFDQDFRRDNARLTAVSPLANADQIKAPVFLIAMSGERTQGLDERAGQARKLHRALTDNGVPAELVVIGEDDVATREQLKEPVRKMMTFLHRHDPGRAAQGTP